MCSLKLRKTLRKTLQTTRTLREEFEKTLSDLDLAGEEQVAVVVKKLVEFLYGDIDKEKKASKAAAENAQAQRRLRVGQEDPIIGSDTSSIIPNQNKSGIAAMARKSLLKRFASRREIDISDEIAALKRTVDATIDDVCAVQQYCDKVEKEIKLRANQCGIAWKVMHDAIFHDHSAVLASLLPTSTMTDKLRRDISYILNAIFNMLLRVIAQMDNILSDITMRFGAGRDLNRHVVEFRKATAYSFKSINRLSSAQILVEKDAREAYSQQMETLASLTSAQLTRIEKVIKQLLVYLRANTSGPLPFSKDIHDLGTETWKAFSTGWRLSYHEIGKLLERARQKPPRRDRSTKWMSTLEVGVATPSEALTALNNLEEILYVIGDFAIQFAMDLGRFLTGRPEDPGAELPGVEPGLFSNPFTIDEATASEALDVITTEIARLKDF
ncbi:hypothetical protein NP233_g12773 [Leucocoprinus birnbaumii]|uniref:Uncharacterized protein n=1 Tax=Leucocoprinus birnbaumii TaxID=56174 RepID=A0AAD5VE46_9AGAR|nr:hypothetical protein NP233_g12773 [Leucocoprinus birnbaumii]